MSFKKIKKNASLTFFTFDFIFIAAFHQTRDGADGRRVGTVAQSFLDQPVTQVELINGLVHIE